MAFQGVRLAFMSDSFTGYVNYSQLNRLFNYVENSRVASVLNLINEERQAMGKSTVGFVNPVLYAHPEVLNDITNGTNAGCDTYGFSAISGWDPATGLGTPNFPKMKELFLSLP